MYNRDNTIVCYAHTGQNWFVDNIDFWYSTLNQKDQQRFKITINLKSRKQFLLGRVLLRYAAMQIDQKATVNQYINPNYHQVIYDNSKYYKSISHSADCAIVILSKVPIKIGIDIETLKERDFLALAEEYFCGNEIAKLRQINFHCHHFYQLWTAKEAYVKATSKKMSDVLALDFSDVLITSSRGKASFCHKFFCYQQQLDNKMISIISAQQSDFFLEAPLLVTKIPKALMYKTQN